MPYSPSQRQAHANTRFLSSRIASAISSAESAGETNAEPVLSRPTTSPPAPLVRSTISSIRLASISWVIGTPATVQ